MNRTPSPHVRCAVSLLTIRLCGGPCPAFKLPKVPPLLGRFCEWVVGVWFFVPTQASLAARRVPLAGARLQPLWMQGGQRRTMAGRFPDMEVIKSKFAEVCHWGGGQAMGCSCGGL